MFVLKFLIGIVATITILLNFFRIIRVDGISSNEKLFHFLVFLLILIFLFQFGLSYSMHRSVMNKIGFPGEIGIRGQKGNPGEDGVCVADCGRKVCGAVLERDSHNALTFYVKKIRGNLKDGEILEKTLIKCAKGPVEESDKNGITITLPKVDLDICKKKPPSLSNNTQSTNDDKVECISIQEVSDELFGKETMEIRYRIKNRLFLNKLKLICSSKQYLSTLEKEHNNKPTEKKLIEYLSSIAIIWIELITQFKIVLDEKPVYLGIIFLMSPDANFDIIESIRDGDGNIMADSPLREIEKYDIWNWGETTTESPLIVTKCITNQEPPIAIEQKLKTVFTNNYDVIFDSIESYPKDIWDTTNCPYGQMGKNNDNPNNIKVCINRTPTEKTLTDNYGQMRKCKSGYTFKPNMNNKNLMWWACGNNCEGGTSLTDNNCNCACEKITEPKGIIEKRIAWKNTEFKRKANIVFLHPKKYLGKYGKTYYPLGTVWTSLKPNKEGKYGKKTLLVTGDIMPPIDYKLLWKSTDLLEDIKPIFKPEIIISIWRPVAPNGYEAFGDVVVRGTGKPSINIDNTPVVCVNKTCISEMPLGSEVWNVADISRIDYKTEENYRIYNDINTNEINNIGNRFSK